ncbi:uncharacterized protein LOC126737088 [Anthonomus grandis grandis]|uniref:uncharacterized protein LOC126737088 n=1 Tax=Anthonomus grandis grandis TaxID=2921223 RepID=UPI002164F3C6|nr:uncharacterized protein LOC126737088 [Anthonomus grandis grandis]
MRTVNIGSMVPWVLALLLCFYVQVNSGKECPQSKRLSTSKLVCYYSSLEEVDGCYCSHVILPANSDVKGIEKVKEKAKGVKIYVTVNEFNQGLIDLLKSTKIDGLELNLKKLDSKNDISDFISTVKSKIGTDLDIALAVPSKAELVAKYFDFKALNKHTDLFILETAFLGASANVTFHPSRLSGMWDMQNTDSVVDLVSGLGAPLAKVVIAAPVQAFQFTLQNSEYSAPGSPALELQSITRKELCRLMKGNKNWTLERDEDQAGPYIFSKNQWIAFEDSKSIDIKAKYSRVRGLAGIALKDLSQDGNGCGSTILEDAYNGLSRQARAPRGAVLHSLEREITDGSSKSLDSVQLSPFRISRIIDTEGKIHVTRQDTRTEFQCSRQGYFVHPRSCNRFYRCVKFDQTSEDYNVFEFDCPAGLAFDERVEVCVWPGSLPHGTPCSGSSEIAPVPKERFVCPSEPGYYPDPENCRWFFACLDHGKSPLSAYEFRCPYGLVFDGKRLVCEWPWLVARCASDLGVGLDTEYYYGGTGSGQGYALRGPQSAGVILENYNGLGQLGTLKLEGVSGKFVKPIATVYSNVGSGSLGLGYQNSNGYIEGGGLSYKAALALQNAGLLKVNNGVGYQANGQQATIYGTSGQGTQYSGQSQGAILVNTGENYGSDNAAFGHATNYQTGQYSANGAKVYSSGQYDASIGNGYQEAGNLHVVQENVATGYGGHSGQYSTEAQGAVINYQNVGTIASGYNNYQDKNVNIVQGNNLATGYSSTGSGTSSQRVTQGSDVQGTDYDGGSIELGKQAYNYEYVGSGENTFGNKLEGKYQGTIQDGHSGAVSTQTITQYHGQGEVSGASADAGSINIIGGGYSAVGSLSGVDVSNNGETHIFSGSPAIISSTTAPSDKIVSVPTVVSVPVPGIKTATGFETLRGGVIANIPELQYKVKTHDIGLFKNFSNGFANFVVTPTITNQNEHLQTYSHNGGFGNKLNRVTVTTARPFVSVTTAQPQTYISSTVQPVVTVEHQTPVSVSSNNFQEYNTNGGYKYEKASLEFEQKPQLVAVSTARPVIVQQQPQIIVSSTPAAPAVSTYSYTQQTDKGGFVYEKPSNPTIISKFSIRKPVVQLKQKTVIEDYTYQQPQTYYQQPSVQLYQQPELLKTYSYQKQPVSTYSYKNVALQAVGAYQQPQVTPVEIYGSRNQYAIYGNKQQEGYVYDKPSIRFEENPVVYSTPKPAVVNTYYNIDNSHVKSQETTGYVYNKPSVEVQEASVTYSTPRPTVVAETPKPAVVTSYFNLENSHAKSGSSQQVGSGYIYNKPAIQFHETPVTYSTPRPVVTVQPIVSVEQPQQSVLTSYDAQSETNSHKSSTGYVYNKPSIEFHESPVTYSTPKPLVTIQPVEEAQPAVVTSYFNIENSHAKSENQFGSGYVYKKPSVEFHEAPVTYSTPKPALAVQPVVPIEQPQPAVVTSYFNLQNTGANSDSNSYQSSSGYVYNKPSVQLHESSVTYSTPKPLVTVQPIVPVKQPQAAVVTSYFNFENANAKSESSSHQSGGAYVYNKPSVEFHEAPVTYTTPKPFEAVEQVAVTYSTPKPIVDLQPVVPVEQPQPAVVTSYFNLENTHTKSEGISQQSGTGYVYDKPSVEFIESPVTYSTPKPAITVQPVVPIEQPQAAVVTSYFNLENSRAQSESSSHQSSGGYVYNKPSIEFHETPVTYSTAKPVVAVEQQKPAVVTSYFNLDNSQSNLENSNGGYVYSQPAVQQVDTSAIPGVVSTYFNSQSNQENSEHQQLNVGYSYPKPAVKFEEAPLIISTPKPFEVKQENFGYSYPKTAVKSEETLVVYSTPQPTVQPAVVSSYVNIGSKHDEQQNVRYEERPAVYSAPKPAQAAVVTSYFNLGSSTSKPEVYAQNGDYEQTIYSTPKPAVVSSYSYVAPSTPRPAIQENVGYTYPKPSVGFVEMPQLVKEEPFVKKTAYVTGQYEQNIQDNFDYRQNGEVVENYQFPQYEKVKQVLFGEKLYRKQEQIQYQQPQVILNYVQSTPKPTFASTIRTIARKKSQPVTPATVTFYDSRYTSTPVYSSTYTPEIRVTSTSRPISKFEFGSQDEQYQYKNLVKSTTAQPVRTYIPVTSTVKYTSALPSVTKGKVVEEYIAPEVTTLVRDYVPVRISTKAPSREYLPVEVSTEPRRRIKVTSTTATPEITTLNREYLPVRARVQITTTASPIEDQTYTVRPRVRPAAIKVSRPVTVIKQNDAHPLLSAKLGAQCTCVSNTLKLRKNQKIIIVEDEENEDDDDGYIVDNGEQGIVENYEAQRVVDITPNAEQVYLKSTTPKPLEIRSRVKVRPVSNRYLPVTEVSEVFIRKNTSPAIIDDDSPSDKEIAKAVRTGLKLVKQAAKEGAKEGTAEVLSNSLDRYGSGGVRSRSETLQGSVDCQRAGLFRHPTECNKFYACRWDCTKKRFTLHVFNCPVHLTFDNSLGACNWPSQGPACVENTLITSD